MAYIDINTKKIAHNLRQVQNVCAAQSVELSVVTKFALSERNLVRFLIHNGVGAIADSNMAAFSKDLPPVHKGLIKTRLSDIVAIPNMPPECRPDLLYVSDEALLQAALALPDLPRVFLIAEAGDYRDGFAPEEIPAVAARYPTLPFAGVAANFGCLSGCMPSVDTIRRLKAASCAAAEAVTNARASAAIPPSAAPSTAVPPEGTAGGLRRRLLPPTQLPGLSIGGTAAYPLLCSGALEGLVTELRMGEGIFFGYDTSGGAEIPGFERGAFTLFMEIVEIREKTIGAQAGGKTALGTEPLPQKTGRRRRAVLDAGALAAPLHDLHPLDAGITLAGQTYDFTVVDITGSTASYGTSGFIGFTAEYAAAARAMLNRFVDKIVK